MAHAPDVIDLPGVEKRPNGLLLDVARPIPQDQIPRWALAGVTWVPWGAANLKTTADGCDAVLSKTVDNFPSFATALPFLVYQGLQCSTLSSDQADMDARLEHDLDVYVSAAFASELMTGTVSGSASFASEATVVSSVARSLARSLQLLEDHLAEKLQGAVGLIHLTPGLLLLAAGGGLVRWIEGQWRTPSGHVVIADAGYDGSAAPTGQGAAASDEAWIYASGPVFYAITEVREVGRRNEESRVKDRNIDVFLSERYGLVAFDPDLVGAAKVSVGSSADGGLGETTATDITSVAIAGGDIACDTFHGVSLYNSHASDAALIYVRFGTEADSTPFIPIALAAGQSANWFLGPDEGIPVGANGIHITNEGAAAITALVGSVHIGTN